MSLEGRHLGRYRLLEPLGSGGMSVVYKGLDTSLQREVAVKVLHPHLARQGEARARLAREARAVARLHHPNILEVFDFADPSSEEAFLVTELVRGETLKSFAQREQFWPPELAAMVIQQLAQALGHAHEAGVIHRDLKPENVMVREDGVLKLMDFGIARVLDPGERMTVTGALVGSPAYMAPEVIDGEPATAESDVFSLGTLLYWLITGALPFSGSNTQATLKRILEGTYADPRAACPAASDELLAILACCLARDPADRYGGAQELEAALSEYLEGLGFSDIDSVLTAFFADPESGRAAVRDRLTSVLLDQAEAEARAGRIPRGLRRVDQALALAPDDARAHGLLGRLQASERHRMVRRRLLRLAVGGTALAVVVSSSVFLARAVKAHRTPVPRAILGSVAPRGGGSPGTTASGTASGAPAPTGGTAQSPSAVASVDPGLSGPVGGSPPESGSSEAPSRTQPTRVGTTRPASTAPARPPAHPALVPVQVLVRPYGYLRVDESHPSTEALSVHALALPPGRHVLRVSCQWCEDQAVTVDVVPGTPLTLAIPARLKPALLRFEFEPSTARVRIGALTRSAADSLEHPFEVPSPRAPTRFLHRVDYEVTLPGYRSVHASVDVLPGATRTLSGRLVPE
jgi:serine/threonine-protein kinase